VLPVRPWHSLVVAIDNGRRLALQQAAVSSVERPSISDVIRCDDVIVSTDVSAATAASVRQANSCCSAHYIQDKLHIQTIPILPTPLEDYFNFYIQKLLMQLINILSSEPNLVVFLLTKINLQTSFPLLTTSS